MPDRQLPHIPSGIELRRLLAYVALIEFGSLQLASEALHLTKEGVAKPIRELRRAFRGQALSIVDEDGRHRPTALGEELYHAAVQMLYIAEGMGRMGSTFADLITIGYLEQHLSFMAPLLAKNQTNKMPAVRGIVFSDQRDIARSDPILGVAALARGVCDILLSHGTEESFESLVATRPLYRSAVLALVPVQLGQTRISIASVARQRLLLPTPTTRQGLYLRRALVSALPDPRDDLDVVVEAQNPTTLIGHALAGLGIAVVPADVVAHAAKELGGDSWPRQLEPMRWVAVVDAADEPLSVTTHISVRRGTVNEPRIVSASAQIATAARGAFGADPYVTLLQVPGKTRSSR